MLSDAQYVTQAVLTDTAGTETAARLRGIGGDRGLEDLGAVSPSAPVRGDGFDRFLGGGGSSSSSMDRTNGGYASPTADIALEPLGGWPGAGAGDVGDYRDPTHDYRAPPPARMPPPPYSAPPSFEAGGAAGAALYTQVDEGSAALRAQSAAYEIPGDIGRPPPAAYQQPDSLPAAVSPTSAYFDHYYAGELRDGGAPDADLVEASGRPGAGAGDETPHLAAEEADGDFHRL